MIYNFSEIDKLKKRFRLYLIFSIALIVVTIGTYIGLGFVIKDDNKVWMQIVLSIVLVFIGWLIIYISFNHLAKDHHRIKFLELIRRGNFISNNYQIVGIDEPITLYKDARCLQVKAQINNSIVVLYWPEDLVCPLAANKKYKLTLSSNFIIDYEETF